MSIESTDTVPPQPPAAAPQPSDTTGTIGEKDRQLAVLTHLSALTGYVIWRLARGDTRWLLRPGMR